MNLIPRRKQSSDDSLFSSDRSLARFRDEIDSVFDRFLRNPWGTFEAGLSTMSGFPQTDLAETDNNVTVTMELPGVEAKDLNIEVSGGTLAVRGEKKHIEESHKHNFHYVERSFGSFSRIIPLPASIDSKQVEARCKDGVLTVTIAKRPDAKPKRIAVKAE